MSEWAFITNHGLVLATIAKHPNLTAREIGDTVGVTERTAHRIIIDLEEAGYISISIKSTPPCPLRKK
jgi:DNA-binding MarR family transcriptional regulator